MTRFRAAERHPGGAGVRRSLLGVFIRSKYPYLPSQFTSHVVGSPEPGPAEYHAIDGAPRMHRSQCLHVDVARLAAVGIHLIPSLRVIHFYLLGPPSSVIRLLPGSFSYQGDFIGPGVIYLPAR